MSDQQETRLGQQVGKYRLVQKLGTGRFGTVYLAEHLYEHTQVAVKVLDRQLTSDELVKNFRHGASMLQLLHPHIVPLFDFGMTDDDHPFLVMEFVSGGTLRDRHPRGERVSLPTVVAYADQIASALQFLHDHHLLHQDIKPENILIRSDGTLMLSDMGIAQLFSQEGFVNPQAETSATLYTAPEQLESHPTFSSDQYALAAVLYELLYGILPSQGIEGIQATQDKDIPETVAQVILKALAKMPEDRFESVEEFAATLHEAALSLPTSLSIEERDTASFIFPKQTPLPISDSKPAAPIQSDTVPSWVVGGGALGILLLLVVVIITLSPTHPEPSPVPVVPQKSPIATITTQPGVPSVVATTPPSVPSVTPIIPEQIKQQWAFSTGAAVQSTPVVVDGVLYIGSSDHKVYALDAITGKQKWAFSTDAAVQSTPVVVDGVLYISALDGRIYALDSSIGGQKWTFSIGSIVHSSPIVVNGVLYIGSFDGSIYALDAGTGTQKWIFPTASAVWSTATIANGVLYVGSDDNKVYALDASTGQQKWTFSTGDSVRSSPVVSNAVVYVGSTDHNIYGIDANTGQLKWVFSTGAAVSSSAMIQSGVLYIGSDDSSVYALTLPA